MKTIVITGISRGIGLAAAKLFLQKGWRVIGTTRNGKYPFKNENLQCFSLELTDSLSIVSFAELLVKKYISIDALIHNAAIRLEQTDMLPHEEALRTTLETNLVGPITLTDLLIPFMNEGCRIVCISSHLSLFAYNFDYDFSPSYRISKAGLNMYALILQNNLALKQKNISVCAITPGKVKTEIGRKDAERTAEEVADDYYKAVISKKENEFGLLYGKSSIKWDAVGYGLPLFDYNLLQERFSKAVILTVFLFIILSPFIFILIPNLDPMGEFIKRYPDYILGGI